MFKNPIRPLRNYKRFAAVLCIVASCNPAQSQCQPSVPATPITYSNDTALVPASRQLVNGTATTIDTTSPGQIKVDVSNSGVTAGSYTNANITVTAQGLVTVASNGTGGSTTAALTAGNFPATVPNVIVPANALVQPLPFNSTLTATSSGSEYTVPTSSSEALGITAGPDGNVWFAEFNQNKIGKISNTGSFTEYTIPTGGSAPWGICSGPDGNLWFSEQSGNKIGKLTTSGSFTEYSVPTTGSQPTGICAGPDGNLWFTENSGNNIGRVTTAGTITEFSVTTSSAQPRNICAGPDGNLWFTETAGNNIAKITLAGAVTEYTIPTASSSPYNICAGPDGNLWFTESATNKVGKVSTGGTFVEYTVPTGSSTPYGICAGPDGNLWLCEYAQDKLTSIATNGLFVEHTLPSTGTGASYLCVGPDGNIWLTEQSTSKIGNWRFCVSGTTPTLNSISAGTGITVTTSGTGITVASSGGQPGISGDPAKRVMRLTPEMGINGNAGFTSSTANDGMLTFNQQHGFYGSLGAGGGGYFGKNFCVNFATASSANAVADAYATNTTTGSGVVPQSCPSMSVVVATSTTSHARYWLCFTPLNNSNTVSGTATPANTVGFRYDTSAGDTHWVTYTKATGSATTFDTGKTPTANSVGASSVADVFTVVFTSATSVSFYIDGTLVHTETSTLPSATTDSTPCISATNLSGGSGNSIYMGQLRIETY